MAKKAAITTNKLLKCIVDAMQDKKAKEVVSIDLRKIETSVTSYFIICSGTSTTQVDAIYDNVIKKVQETLYTKPFHREGFENSEWILIDYFDIVVHIFIEGKRNFYKLEELWADGVLKQHKDVG